MPMPAEEITLRIQAAIPDATIVLTDLAGDGDHWQVSVTSSCFTGLPRVKQHKLVYDAIGGDMGTVLHALSIRTQAPSS